MKDLYTMFICLAVAYGMNSDNALAAVRMGATTSDVYFKIDGKKATAVEADANALDHRIEKCSPVKNTEPPAFKCVEVVKEFNARTGAPSWKRP